MWASEQMREYRDWRFTEEYRQMIEEENEGEEEEEEEEEDWIKI